MSIDNVKIPLLQRMASGMIAQVFPGGVSRSARAQLLTSIVRQWRTYEGHAALLTDQCRYWLKLTCKSADQYNVAFGEIPGSPLQAFLDDWDIDPGKSPKIIERLNIS